MFERKDVIPASFLLVLIVTIMITLSQILVVHNTNHNANRNKPREIRKFQAMLIQLEKSIDSMMKKDVLPKQKHEVAFIALVYSLRINALMEDAKNATGKIPLDNDTLAPTDNKLNRTLVLVTNKSVSSALNKLQSDVAVLSLVNSTKNASDKHEGYESSVEDEKNKDINHRRNLLRNIFPFIYNDGEDGKTELTTVQNKSNYSSGRDEHDTVSAQIIYTDSTEVHVQQHRTRNKWRTNVLPRCAEIPTDLIGRLNINLKRQLPTLQPAQSEHGAILPGGVWRPTTCVPRHRVAIIIPYRDRRKHLQVLLAHLLPVLQRQQLDFRIFVVEQEGTKTFNKGRIMNAAFLEALKADDYHCFVFHDVDMIPEDDRNMYTCPEQPRHMSVAVDKFNYILPYTYLTGGVFSIKREHFEKVNGFSNLYWGWGAEDDDMGIRLGKAGLKITRPPAHLGRYSMIKHTERERAPIKWRKYLLQTVKKRYQKDGLNTLDYNVTFIHSTTLYTHIMVNIGEPPKQVPDISSVIR